MEFIFVQMNFRTKELRQLYLQTDLGFSRWGANPKGMGRQPIIWPINWKLHENEEIWPGMGSLRSPLKCEYSYGPNR